MKPGVRPEQVESDLQGVFQGIALNDVGFNASNLLVFRVNTAALNEDRGRYERMVETVLSVTTA